MLEGYYRNVKKMLHRGGDWSCISYILAYVGEIKRILTIFALQNLN